ncbi:MAG: tetratricopeptide repeat protein [Actinomycetota bacterium]|nr:tetratricopeptide repeat protein [Actinomycetota bacterium]
MHVDEIESLPALDGELQWKPVRQALEIDAFGINAYHGENEGDLVVEEHADPHQELYLVVRGTARFRSDEEEFEAPAGTFVLFDPHEHRVAHAAEPGTTVVAVGAEAKRFEPSVWEYAFRAHGLWQLGRHDEGLRAIQEGLERHPKQPRLLYDLACLESLGGDADSALAHLEEALAEDAKLAERAREDEDFDPIRGDPRFEAVLAKA